MLGKSINVSTKTNEKVRTEIEWSVTKSDHAATHKRGPNNFLRRKFSPHVAEAKCY